MVIVVMSTDFKLNPLSFTDTPVAQSEKCHAVQQSFVQTHRILTKWT